MTDLPGTDPPATDPPATDPPATDPPATDPPATDPNDPYLPERIRRALADPTAAGELDVQVVVRAGRVTLTGNVADERRRDEIGDLVGQLVPDLVVCNEIDVMRRPGGPASDVTEEHLS